MTGFHYKGDVTASYNEARMLPASTDGQLVLFSNLDILPISSQHAYVDYWGTRVSSFEILTPHKELALTATSLVEVRPREHPEHRLGWDDLATAAATATEYVEQLKQTRRTEPPAEVAKLAADLIAQSDNPCDAALAICTMIGDSVEYMQGVTGVHTTAAEAWSGRRGVCQDIAHVAGESHAWVEWFCGSWRGFDPTNLIDIGDRHVTVGHGRDYNDVAPLRGIYAGPSSSSLFVTVEITREA
jgi:transglutaminase-like putative cysteine protease